MKASPGTEAEKIWEYLAKEGKTLPGAVLATRHMLITNSKEQNGSWTRANCSRDELQAICQRTKHSIKMLIEAAVG